MSDITYAYAGDIVKTKSEDGDLIVYGKATGPDIDLDEQICDPAWLKEAMPEWMKFGNVREMHQPIAAGVGLELNAEGDDWFLKSQVIDDNTARKIEAGALKGYSVGIKGAKVIKDAAARGGRIVGGTIVEISYVDRPANPTCSASIAKAVGGDWNAVETQIVDLDKVDDPNAPENQNVNLDSDWNAEDMYQLNDNNEDLYPGTHLCSVCDGLGKFPDTGTQCPHCEGSGRVNNSEAEDGLAQNEVMDRKKPKDSNAQMTQDDIDRHIEGKSIASDTEMKRDYSDAERADMADAGQAMPGGGFPIKTVADLKNAIQAFGRAKNPAAAKTHIKARAAALGREDLIPENWKAVEGETEKVEHNAADLEAVRSSLVALIAAELAEITSGEEDEVCDVRNLLVALQIFLDWWQGEANEGETAPPFMTTETEEDDNMAYMAMGVSADIIKAASEGGEEAVAELRTEIVKALGLDELTKTVTDLSKAAQRIELLEAELDRVKEMAAPGGPVKSRTQMQTSKAFEAERMQAEASHFRQMAKQISDPSLSAQYQLKAAQLDKTASEIIGA
jgi:uncharacterized Zn finger protein (UPF0148 family)